MATGDTVTDALSDSLDTVVASAIQVNEFEGVMSQLVDRQTLEQGTGTSWREVDIEKQSATAISETSREDNPQQFQDTLRTIKPTMVSISNFVTDVVGRQINKKTLAQMGSVAMNAIVRKIDLDGLALFSSASTVLSAAGNAFIPGYISAASTRITSNSTEPGLPPIRAVLHGNHIKDIYDKIAGPTQTGTYPTPEGLTARVFAEGFKGSISGAQVFEDGNIQVDSADDAYGGVFAQKGIVLVQGKTPWSSTERKEGWGGGGTIMYVRGEDAYGERKSGIWLYGIIADATAPTS